MIHPKTIVICTAVTPRTVKIIKIGAFKTGGIYYKMVYNTFLLGQAGIAFQS